MTPEEERALLLSRLGAAAPLVEPRLEQAQSFRDRIMGAAPQLALGTLSHAPGLVGGAATAAQVAPAGVGLIPQDVQDRAGEVGNRLFGPGRQMLSFERGEQPVTSPGGQIVRQMYTPDVNVQAAPTLDPKYGQIGRPMGGGAGGGGGNPLKLAWEDAQQNQLKLGDEEVRGAWKMGDARVGRIEQVADREAMEAERQQREAQERAAIEQQAAAKHEAFLQRSQEMVDELGKLKTDPGRLMRNADTGTRIAMNIGAIASGMLAGLQGGPNRFLDRIDKYIEQDINAQQAEIDNKKSQISARASVFGQILQETGDRRVSALQFHNMMLEASKLKLKADTDKYGIPEAKAQSELVLNGLEQRQAGVRTALAQESYQAFLRQAAAAASAQKAAEREMFERAKWIAEMGLKQDQLAIERAKASGQTAEDVNKQTQSLGAALGAKELSEGRAAVENAKQRLKGLKPDEGLPGVGRMADFRASLKPEGFRQLDPVAQGINLIAGLSDQDRVSRSDWEKIKLAYQHQITGSGASEGERKMLSAAFEGAKSPAEQRAAIAQADDFFSRREEAIKAGYDPKVVKLYEDRRTDLVLKDSGAVKK